MRVEPSEQRVAGRLLDGVAVLLEAVEVQERQDVILPVAAGAEGLLRSQAVGLVENSMIVSYGDWAASTA
ncbi:MAG: hypothetical protein M3401_17065 [Actinomycetota bacterium]|nr:hypothetical protein [Actinomycetota bacterium]